MKLLNRWLAGSITDDKLNQITTANKVAGSAIQLNSNSGLEDSTGLKLKLATTGSGLIISDVEGNKGLTINSLGVTNAMLAGSIDSSKLDLSKTYAFTGPVSFGQLPTTGGVNLATENYVDNKVSGLKWREPVDHIVHYVINDSTAVSTLTDGEEGEICLHLVDKKFYTLGSSGWDAGQDVTASVRLLFAIAGVDSTGGFNTPDNKIYIGGDEITAKVPEANWALLVKKESFNVGGDSGWTYDEETTSWVRFTGAGQLEDGNGIAISGNTISVDVAEESGLFFKSGKLAVGGKTVLPENGNITFEVTKQGMGSFKTGISESAGYVSVQGPINSLDDFGFGVFSKDGENDPVFRVGLSAKQFEVYDASGDDLFKIDFDNNGDIKTDGTISNLDGEEPTVVFDPTGTNLSATDMGAAIRELDSASYAPVHGAYKISEQDETNGYFELPDAPSTDSNVVIWVDGGIHLVNIALVGSTGITPDFGIGSTNKKRVYFKKDKQGDGDSNISNLSDELMKDDVVFFLYWKQ